MISNILYPGLITFDWSKTQFIVPAQHYVPAETHFLIPADNFLVPAQHYVQMTKYIFFSLIAHIIDFLSICTYNVKC